MNSKGLVVATALLFGVGLTPALPGVGLQTVRAEDLKEMFPVDFGTSAGWNGQTRVTGYIKNGSGVAADHLRLVISGLDAKGHVISRVHRTLDGAIPADDRTYFDAQVSTSPSYRVDVDRLGSFQAS